MQFQNLTDTPGQKNLDNITNMFLQKLAKTALLKLLKEKRDRLKVLDDLAKGKNLERSAMKADPTYRAAQGQLPVSRSPFTKSRPDTLTLPKASAYMDKAMKSKPILRKHVTAMVKELRKRGGKLSEYKTPGMQKELNKMQRQKKKMIKRGYKFK